MQSADYAAMFPSPDARVPERVSAEEWSTTARAKLLDANPSFKALGLGTGFTGLGVDTLIIDDPYKNREEALSEATNANVWGWWSDVVLPRMNPSTNVVVMFHRWQDNDLAGRLLQQGGWEYLRFAAIGDGDVNDPMGRSLGELLSPRYPLEYLEDVRRKQGSSFYALYQGTPRAPEGDYFKRGWFEIVGALPVGCVFERYWDLAGGITAAADRTSGVLMARDPRGYYYIAHVRHGRWAAAERNAIIKQTAHEDRQKYGRVITHIEQAPGLSKEPTEDLVRQLAGYPVYADKVTKDKASRAEPFQAQAQAGNVKIVDADWNGPYLDELCSFPTGDHDDDVDGSSGAFNMLANRARKRSGDI
jgi:predicted phage terminase large subunit-like protein